MSEVDWHKVVLSLKNSSQMLDEEWRTTRGSSARNELASMSVLLHAFAIALEKGLGK